MDDFSITKDNKREENDLNKYANYYYLMHYWMINIENGKSLDQFFYKRGYGKIAIYGNGYLGRHLESQLPETLKPIFTIDQGVVKYKGKTFSIDESTSILSKADVIIVTPVADYENIKKLFDPNIIEVVSLEEVILSL